MGITYLNAFASLIGINYAENPFYIFIGLISLIDQIFKSLILPKWTPAILNASCTFLTRKGIDFKRNEYLIG